MTNLKRSYSRGGEGRDKCFTSVLVRNRSTGLSTPGQNKEKGQKAEIAKEKQI